MLDGGLFDFCISCQHSVEHAPHFVVQLNIEQGNLTVNLREPLAEPCKRLFQHGAGSPAFTQINLPGSGQFLILVDSPADTGFGTDIGAQLPVVFLHRLIGKAILHGPEHLEKVDVSHFVGQRGQVGRFEELYNVVAFALVEAHLAVDNPLHVPYGVERRRLLLKQNLCRAIVDAKPVP